MMNSSNSSNVRSGPFLCDWKEKHIKNELMNYVILVGSVLQTKSNNFRKEEMYGILMMYKYGKLWSHPLIHCSSNKNVFLPLSCSAIISWEY